VSRRKKDAKISALARRAKRKIDAVGWAVYAGTGISDRADFASFVAGMQFTLSLSYNTVPENAPNSCIDYKCGHDAMKAAHQASCKNLEG
jgi:hypothetical protein